MSVFKLLVGAVSGLTAGLLFAKKSGVDFRKDLKGKTNEEKAEVFGKEILSMGKDLLGELKKLPESEQVEKLKTLGKEKLEVLGTEIKKHSGEKMGELKEFGEGKLDELLPKIKSTLEDIKKNGSEAVSEKISDAKKFSGEKFDELKDGAEKGAKQLLKKKEGLGAKMTKIFKK